MFERSNRMCTVLAALLLMGGCQKLPPVHEPDGPSGEQTGEEEPGLPVIDDSASPSLISAEIPAAVASKVALEGVGSSVSLSWEAGDCIRVAGSGGSEVFTIVEQGMTPSKAGFTGKPVGGTSFSVLYPGTYADYNALLARSYEGQVQTGNGSADHLEWNAAVLGLPRYGSVVFGASSPGEFLQSGVIRFRFTVPERFEPLTAIRLSAAEPIFRTTNDPDGPRTTSLSLSLRDLGLTETARDLTAYMMASWTPVLLEEGQSYTLTLVGEDGQEESIEKTVPEGGLQIGGGVVTTLTLDGSDLQEPLFWGGEGTESAPYEIKTFKHLTHLEDATVQGADFWFRLVDDIALTPTQAESFKEIQNFKGHLDGAGHRITGLTAPLFGNLRGAVRDLDITADITHDGNADSRFVGTDYGIGILAHYAYNDVPDAAIEKVTVRGTLKAEGVVKSHNYLIGGMLGATNGVPLTQCKNYASVTVDGVSLTGTTTYLRVGGLVGALQNTLDAMPSDCENLGGVAVHAVASESQVSVGGVIGHSGQSLTITRCINNGAITADFASENSAWIAMGGVLGSSDAQVKLIGCENHSPVTNAVKAVKNFKTGGIAGYLLTSGSNLDGILLDGCVNTGEVKDQATYATAVNHYCAGIVGHLVGAAPEAEFAKLFVQVKDCRNEASVTCVPASCSTAAVGGIAGTAEHYALFSKCENTGSVSMSSDAVNCYMSGILAHTAKGSHLDGCTNRGGIGNTGKMTGLLRTGGIIGNFNCQAETGVSAPFGTVENCINEGTVRDESATTCNTYMGGIFGGSTNGTTYALSNENTGDVTSIGASGATRPNLSIGGIAGYMGNANGKIDGCKSRCTVTGTGTITTLRPGVILGACGTSAAFTISGCRLAGSVNGTTLTEGNFRNFICGYKNGEYAGADSCSLWIP